MAKQASKKRDRKIRQLNPNAAGIDIGSRKHYAARPKHRSATGSVSSPREVRTKRLFAMERGNWLCWAVVYSM